MTSLSLFCGLATLPRESDRPAEREPTADGEEPRWSSESNDVEQKSLEAEESHERDKGETPEKTIVLVSKISADTFEISGGATLRDDTENVLFMVINGNGQTLSG